MNLCVELYSMFMYESSVNGGLQDRNEVVCSNYCHADRKIDILWLVKGAQLNLFSLYPLSGK